MMHADAAVSGSEACVAGVRRSTQGKYYVGHLLRDDRPPAWSQVTVYLVPGGRVQCDIVFMGSGWTNRRLCGMPLASAVRGHESPIPAIVSVLVTEIEARGTCVP